jgi:hypothetical protein
MNGRSKAWKGRQELSHGNLLKLSKLRYVHLEKASPSQRRRVVDPSENLVCGSSIFMLLME